MHLDKNRQKQCILMMQTRDVIMYSREDPPKNILETIFTLNMASSSSSALTPWSSWWPEPTAPEPSRRRLPNEKAGLYRLPGPHSREPLLLLGLLFRLDVPAAPRTELSSWRRNCELSTAPPPSPPPLSAWTRFMSLPRCWLSWSSRLISWKY